ncbi:MAG: response regulator, partial [Bradymonadaceae bacterium]
MSRHILLTDDEHIFRKNLARYLRQQGYEVTEAEHGEHALELMGSQDFALLLSDIHMPGM